MRRRTRRVLSAAILGGVLTLAFVLFRAPIEIAIGSTSSSSSRTPNGGASASLDTDPARLFIDGGAIRKTIADRRVHDELRRRILAGWMEGAADDVKTIEARRGRFPSVPSDDSSGARISPSYIQSVVREDFFPMARKCYEELLTRNPNAKGRVTMRFKIVADDDLGGIVEEAVVRSKDDPKVEGEEDADDHEDKERIVDEKMTTCMSESMSTLAFPPPKGDGWVDVIYPFVFEPGD